MRRSGIPRAVAWALEGMGSRPDRGTLLEAWAGLVLVIHGEEDAFIPVAEARETVSRLKHGRGVFVPAAGHLLNHEKPAEFSAAVADFLQTPVLT